MQVEASMSVFARTRACARVCVYLYVRVLLFVRVHSYIVWKRALPLFLYLFLADSLSRSISLSLALSHSPSTN